VVDASQGVEAQTVANDLFSRFPQLTILPVINKIDCPLPSRWFRQGAGSKMCSHSRRRVPHDQREKRAFGVEDVLEAMFIGSLRPRAARTNPFQALGV